MVIYLLLLKIINQNFVLYHSPLIGFILQLKIKEIVIALNACGANVGFVEINSDKGHDSFLLNVPEFLRTVSEFLSSTYNEINNEKGI